MRANEEGFACAQINVRLGKLRASCAHGFDFPALKRKARFVALLNEVVEARLAVLGNQAGGGRGLSHERKVRMQSAMEQHDVASRQRIAQSHGARAPAKVNEATHAMSVPRTAAPLIAPCAYMALADFPCQRKLQI